MNAQKFPPGDSRGGGSGLANNLVVEYPDGSREKIGKVTAKDVPAGSKICITVGGGGGYGLPSERDPDAVNRDLAEGYISKKYAKKHYGNALTG